MQGFSDVHIAPNQIDTFANSVTTMPPRTTLASGLCQVFLWSYFVPGLIIYYVFYAMGYEINVIAPLLYGYIITATLFNCFIVSKIIKDSDNQRNPNVLDIETPPSASSVDSPPPYWDAVKDPPSYNFLQYYKSMIWSRSWIRRNNSLEKPKTSEVPPSTSNNPNQIPGKDRRTALYRNFSCPN